MADEPENIVLQHLIAIRADITAIRARLDGMDKRLEQLEYGQTVHLHALFRVERDIEGVKEQLGKLDARISRLEKPPLVPNGSA